MKSEPSTKDNNFSLRNIENYNKELTAPVVDIVNKYLNLLIEYYKFFIEKIKIKNIKVLQFIIIRGLDTITNVFLNLLLYTKNIDLTFFHCQKSFYFYVEFVGQISEDEKMFLQLTSRDASTYVYKKTIFEIMNEFKNSNKEMTITNREKFEIINVYVNLCKNYLLKIIERNEFSENAKFINLIEKIMGKLNNNQIKIDKLKLFENINDKLITNIENTNHFFDVTQQLVKKFVKNNDILDKCEKKNLSEEFANKISIDSPEKFVAWLLSSI